MGSKNSARSKHMKKSNAFRHLDSLGYYDGAEFSSVEEVRDYLAFVNAELDAGFSADELEQLSEVASEYREHWDLSTTWYELVSKGAVVYRVMELDGSELEEGAPENRFDARVVCVPSDPEGRWLLCDDVDGVEWVDAQQISDWQSGEYTTTLEVL